MDKPTITYLSKKIRKAMTLLREMTYKESPGLQYIFTNGQVQAASNGFALVMVKHDQELPEECAGRKDFRFVTGTDMAIVSPPDFDTKFPDLNKIYQKPDAKPAYEITLNPVILLGILRQFQGCRIIGFRFWAKNSTVEMTGINDDGEAVVFGSLMPMYSDQSSGKFERPAWTNISFNGEITEVKP